MLFPDTHLDNFFTLFKTDRLIHFIIVANTSLTAGVVYQLSRKGNFNRQYFKCNCSQNSKDTRGCSEVFLLTLSHALHCHLLTPAKATRSRNTVYISSASCHRMKLTDLLLLIQIWRVYILAGPMLLRYFNGLGYFIFYLMWIIKETLKYWDITLWCEVSIVLWEQ